MLVKDNAGCSISPVLLKDCQDGLSVRIHKLSHGFPQGVNNEWYEAHLQEKGEVKEEFSEFDQMSNKTKHC